MIETVAVLSPGDMGHAIGRRLRQAGLRVVTSLQGRSQRSASLAAQAGIEDVADDDALVREADVLLAVLVPSAAPALAERIATAVERTGAKLLYADLNAIAPQTVQAIGARLTRAGARFVDGGIIGGPPRDAPREAPGASGATITPGTSGRGDGPRVYVSGATPDTDALATLGERGLDVRVMGQAIGQASGLKMCYAAMTKGLTALATELLVAGEAMGLSEPCAGSCKGARRPCGR
jgi:3-hydroxyisobutyrate dehydrogenase-like beta-hydroxyacid dehydrogenase